MFKELKTNVISAAAVMQVVVLFIYFNYCLLFVGLFFNCKSIHAFQSLKKN